MPAGLVPQDPERCAPLTQWPTTAGLRALAAQLRQPPDGNSAAIELGGHMITATVRYKLPPHIDRAACREHFHTIAPEFRHVKGLISKHFIRSGSGWAEASTSGRRSQTRKRSMRAPGATASSSRTA